MNERNRPGNEISLPIQPDRDFVKRYEELPEEAAIALTPGVEVKVGSVQIVIERYNAWQQAQAQIDESRQAKDVSPRKKRGRDEIIATIQAQFGGVDIRTILDTLYTTHQLSAGEIGTITGASERFICKLLKSLDISIRNMSQVRLVTVSRSPGSERTRIEAIRQAWRERKDEIVEKIHAGDSDKKRSEGNRRRMLADPEYRERRIQVGKDAAKILHDKSVVRQQKVFGPDRKLALAQMHYEEGLTPQQIASKTGYAVYTILNFFYKDGVENLTPSKKWFGKFQDFARFIPLLWADPTLLKRLTNNEQYVLRRRFLSEEPATPTLREIGEELGLTVERISQLEDKALFKLEKLATRLAEK